jgi:hypothetical protein
MHIDAQMWPAITGLQNLPIYYIVVLRETGAAYYAASLPNAHGLIPYPQMRPLAIDSFGSDTPLYAAIYQSVLGQIGWRVDTRVYETCVAQLDELASWWGSAHAADRLQGDHGLAGSLAEQGGRWTAHAGDCQRAPDGATPCDTENLLTLDPGAVSGLIHLLITTGDGFAGEAGILWRFQDADNCWSFTVGNAGAYLQIKENGTWGTLASAEEWVTIPGKVHALQILDDGSAMRLSLDGRLVFDTEFTDTRLQAATATGICAAKVSGTLCLRDFEAHPRSVPIPAPLQARAPWLAAGTKVEISEDFAGEAGDLAGKTTTAGDQIWRKQIGTGAIALTGHGAARVCASATQPAPGRIAYTVGWHQPDLADLQLKILPPGSRKGQGERGRGGFIFWQDEHNYITISTWLDDNYDGASISSFFHVNGFEELYDAVWTNVGQRVYWGKPYVLRVVFDGMNYLAYVDDEPVLFRALSDVYPGLARLHIQRVGIVANWEWGTDTGSTFYDFVAKR